MAIQKKKILKKEEEGIKEDIVQEELEEIFDEEDLNSESPTQKKYKAFFADIESIKFDEEYDRLKDIVKLNETRASKDKILQVLDNICYDAKIAGFLYVRAKKEFSIYEKLDYAIWYSKKINEAIEELGQRTGSEKVEAWIITKYEKEYKEKTRKLMELKMVRDALEIFYAQFNDRKSILQSQNKIANQ